MSKSVYISLNVAGDLQGSAMWMPPLGSKDGILCCLKRALLLLKRMEFGMFFTQKAFSEEGEMLMPIPNPEGCWLPEFTPKMMWHFSFFYPLMGLKNPLHIDPKKYPDYQDAEHLGRNWRADVSAPL